ncbi:hypothetical protein B9Z55_027076 [Caenorhabditis nigoni]|uniref:Uncharacterized protein n=2 Tax=Caenorhabditis nigoni TaxID=1611254 RepID=A0A2G5SJ55_9PELO|nr:hypothetical protein B9Z55_027076 [Caenorhabditis nigoni]
MTPNTPMFSPLWSKNPGWEFPKKELTPYEQNEKKKIGEGSYAEGSAIIGIPGDGDTRNRLYPKFVFSTRQGRQGEIEGDEGYLPDTAGKIQIFSNI